MQCFNKVDLSMVSGKVQLAFCHTHFMETKCGSRWDSRKNKVHTEWELREGIFHYIFRGLNSYPKTDQYASRLNTQFCILQIKLIKMKCAAIKTFLLDWKKLDFYAFHNLHVWTEFYIFKAMGRIFCSSKFGYITGKNKSWQKSYN